MASSSAVQEPLVPPFNFAMVCPGIYRSGYPTRKNFQFLRALRLRSILYLCPEEYAESNLKFCEENNINVLRFPTEGNKEPFLDIPEALMHRILTALCDTRNHPLLIHCNKGKHRTGTITACLRLIQNWSLVSIFEEYKRFAGDKVRVCDQQYVELYNPIVRISPSFSPRWLYDGIFTHANPCTGIEMSHQFIHSSTRIKIVSTEQELLIEEAKQQGYSILSADSKTKHAVPVTTVKGNIITTTLTLESHAQTISSPPGTLLPETIGTAHGTVLNSVKKLNSISVAATPISNNLKNSEAEGISDAHPSVTHASGAKNTPDVTVCIKTAPPLQAKPS